MANATKKTAAIALAAGLALSGSAGIVAPIAGAQTGAPSTTTRAVAPSASTISSDSIYTLSIHKRVNPSSTGTGTGAAETNPYGTGLDGVGFRIRKLDGNITNQETFNRLADVANNFAGTPEAINGLKFDNTVDRSGQTANGGNLSFTDLPAGAYLVEETSVPAGRNIVQAKPFIAFVPFTNPSGEGWLNEVHVYPKNSELRATKSVEDAGINSLDTGATGQVGESGVYLHGDSRTERPDNTAKVTYTLEGLVPAPPQGKVLKNFTLNDRSKSDELRFDTVGDSGNVKVESVVRVRNGAATSIPTNQYTVTPIQSVSANARGDVADGADQQFSVIIADPAAAELQPGDTVRVVVQATLEKRGYNADGTPNALNDQQIENSVNETGYYREPGQSVGDGDEPDFDTPDEKVVSYIGDIEIFKTGTSTKNGQETKAPLEGANFAISICGANDAQGNPTMGKTIQSGETDANGRLTFPGLHVTDFKDGAEVTDTAEIYNYCVQEVKAPAGYEKDPNVHRISLRREDRNVLTDNGAAVTGNSAPTANATFVAAADGRTTNGIVLNNVKRTTPTLPSTGGMGVVLLALAGLAIVGGGVYAARRNSKVA